MNIISKADPEVLKKVKELKAEIEGQIEETSVQDYSQENFPKLQQYIEGIEKEHILSNYFSLRSAELEFIDCENCPGLESCPKTAKGVLLLVRLLDGQIKPFAKKCTHKKRAEMLNGSGLGSRFKSRTLENFEIHPGNKIAMEKVSEFIQNFEADRPSLFLVGPTGVGKTHLAAGATQKIIEQGYEAMFMPCPDMLQRLRNEFNEDGPRTLMGKLQKVPLLVLDDLGSENITGWAKETFFNLINYRYEGYKPIIVTTNCSKKMLEDKIGNRTISRLLEMCAYRAEMSGPDWRIKKL